MDRILSILRAAHCRSTHHYFAIDALSRIRTAQGGRLADLLLKYYSEYLAGAKAPDTSFKDFQNHVLHVGSHNWGGAPQACEKWLATTVEHLDNQRWRQAAYACGVLSHYFTDPIMPLHTAQSDRESIVHRPLEWSVCKSYDALYAQCTTDQIDVKFRLASSSDWISQAVVTAARIANTHYSRLVEIYDIEQGSKHPQQGLNSEARQILSEMFGVAISGWAAVLTRLADQTTVDIPSFSLSLTTLLAAIDIPLAWVARKISDASEQREVLAIFKEYQATGTLVKNLPSELRVVREAHAKHLQLTEPTALSAAVPMVDSPVESVSAISTPEVLKMLPAHDPISENPVVRDPVVRDAVVRDTVVRDTVQADAVRVHAFQYPVFKKLVLPSVNANDHSESMPIARQPQRLSIKTMSQGWKDSRQARVALESNLVDAPSIGPKTAKRFQDIGVFTVGQFLASSPENLVERLATRWITAQLLSEWQDQARLVCEVPDLNGYQSQLLVAVDCRNAASLADGSADDLHKRIAEFCRTKAAAGVLRGSVPPSLSEVVQWISAARNGQLRIAA